MQPDGTARQKERDVVADLGRESFTPASFYLKNRTAMMLSFQEYRSVTDGGNNFKSETSWLLR